MTEAAVETNPISLVGFRLAEETDLPFVYMSIVKTLMKSTHWGWLSADFLIKHHNSYIENCLKRPTTKLVIAHPHDDPPTILGFLLAEPKSILHFVYVKEPFRRYGLAKAMLERLGMVLDKHCIFTHYTDDAATVLKAGKYKCRYYPYRF